jgi:hypothetical protein
MWAVSCHIELYLIDLRLYSTDFQGESMLFGLELPPKKRMPFSGEWDRLCKMGSHGLRKRHLEGDVMVNMQIVRPLRTNQTVSRLWTATFHDFVGW